MSKLLLGTPSKHSFSVAAALDDAWSSLLDGAFARTWSPLTRLAESGVTALMRRIHCGTLHVSSPTHAYIFPSTEPDEANEHSGLNAELRVINEAFWVRLCTMGDLGFAEAYMYGDVECDDLVSVFLLFLKNRDSISSMRSPLSYLFKVPQKLTSYRFLNTVGNTRSNNSAHYDLSNEIFANFLSEDMTYSCGIFADLDGDLVTQPGSHGSLNCKKDHQGAGEVCKAPEPESLHDAQLRKLHHIIKKCRIFPGHRVLEIGSGWGSLSILIAQTVPGTTIDTLTLSVQQQSLAMQRIRAAGLEEQITVHLMDYRNMPEEWESTFDRVVSIEMIEAVGNEFLETYWRKVNWAMKRNGVGVVQSTTLPEPRNAMSWLLRVVDLTDDLLGFERYVAEIDFIRKWASITVVYIAAVLQTLMQLFPGICLPTVTLMLQTMHTGSKGTLVVDSVSNIGPHYSRTLREWRRKFLERFESHIVPALQKEYSDLMGPACGEQGRREIDVFKRRWIYY